MPPETPRSTSAIGRLPGDLGDRLGELARRRLEVLVHDHVVELAHRLQLDPAGREPGGDLPLGVGRAALQAPAELGERGRGDEDRGRLGHVAAHRAGPLQLDLDERRRARGEDPLDLRAQRPVAVAGVLDVLEEGALRDQRLELRGAQEVVLDPVDLARPAAAGGGRHRDLQPREAGKDSLDERPLPRPRRARDDDDPGTPAYRCSSSSSSVRCRSDRPPTALPFDILQVFRNRVALTFPYFGTAISMSNTLAVITKSGGLAITA